MRRIILVTSNMSSDGMAASSPAHGRITTVLGDGIARGAASALDPSEHRGGDGEAAQNRGRAARNRGRGARERASGAGEFACEEV
ncbi:hypothetical protein WME79_35095 [Sorangium sp. So ce726]|uniref:hypothetical protein n=1 Tax=Sorangium sp. So ce726 TaxID=3133319 RepID=UPI003F604449